MNAGDIKHHRLGWFLTTQRIRTRVYSSSSSLKMKPPLSTRRRIPSLHHHHHPLSEEPIPISSSPKPNQQSPFAPSLFSSPSSSSLSPHSNPPSPTNPISSLHADTSQKKTTPTKPKSIPPTVLHSLLHGLPKSGPKTNHARQQTQSSYALQGMGTLFFRGTRAMNDLVVVHLMEDDFAEQLRLFLRVLFRSGLTARADVVFIFPSHLSSSSSVFATVIREENDSFLKLVRRYREGFNSTGVNSVASFGVTQFVNFGKKEKERGEPIWGRRIRGNYSDSDELTELSYGSVVGFEAAELDPENSLAGFLDHVPMSLRRWACYPMLLGRVRRNYKHMMLVEMKNMLILGDPLFRVRNRSPESVYLSTTRSSKHHRKNSDKTRPVNSAIIMGGSRGVRRLSNAMLTEIVRVTMQRKNKSSVTESAVLNQLVRNEFVLKNINLVASTESIPDASSLGGAKNSNSGSSSSSLSGHTVVQRGNSNNNHDINSIIMNEICSSVVDSSVYRDCELRKKQRK